MIEARGRDPLLPPRLLAGRNTATGIGVILVYGLTLQCVPYFLTLHCQDVLGYDAVTSGLAFLGPTLAGRDTAGLTGEALRAATADGLRSAVLVAAVVALAGAALPALRPARRDRTGGARTVKDLAGGDHAGGDTVASAGRA